MKEQLKISDLPFRISYEEDGIIFDYSTSLSTDFIVKALCEAVKETCRANDLQFKEKLFEFRGNLPEDSKGFGLTLSKNDLLKLLSIIGNPEGLKNVLVDDLIRKP
jgi:hypothetical protein